MIVIILVHNQQKLTENCFNSIDKSADSKDGVKIIVVDNASDNADWIKRECETRGYTYRRNDTNKWFTDANAEVIDAYPGEDIYLLNNDTEVADGWLSGRAILPSFGAIGAVQTVAGEPRFLQFLGGQDDYCGHKVAWEWRLDRDFPAKDGIIPAIWLTGAAMMINRAAYDKVGGMDLALKHYCSDSDLSLRLGAAGYTIGVAKGMRVMHHGSVTFQDVGGKDPRFQQQGLWDQENFARKHRIKCGQFDFRTPEAKAIWDARLGEDIIKLRNIEASKVEAETLLKAFPDLPKWRVLEFGCAYGEVVRYLREAGADAYGIDNSEAATANGYSYIKQGDVTGAWGDIFGYRNIRQGEDMSPHGENDLIFSKAVLEHLPENKISSVIGQIYFSLKKGALTHHNIDTCHGNDETHITIKTIDWWKTQFEAVGFETIETRHLEGGIYWCTWRKK